MIGLVLSGGGAKGAIQLGVLISLYKKGIRPDIVYGTSVGSLNALALNYLGIEGTKNVWLGVRGRGDILSLNLLKMMYLNPKGIYSTDPLRAKLEKIVAENKPSIKSASCYVNHKTGETRYAYNANPHYVDYTVASSAIPFVMDPAPTPEGPACDGGVTECTPLKVAIDDGCTTIYVIQCSKTGHINQDWEEPGYPLPLVGYGLRALSIQMSNTMKNDINVCLKKNADSNKKTIDIKLYEPEKEIIDSLEFDPVKIRAAIAYGQEIGKRPPKKL